jgi:glycosyltransferase involved in cell wall biosynthesis
VIESPSSPPQNFDAFDAAVVIPVLNGRLFIEECLNSVFSQETHFNFCVIVVDDGSTDGTQELVRHRIKFESRLFLLANSGHGVAEAINTAINFVKCRYIIRIDADDIMCPDRISIQLNFLQNNPDFIAVGGQIELFGAEMLAIPSNPKLPTSYMDTISKLAEGCFFAHPAMTYVRQSALKVSLLDNKFEGAEDYDFWLKLSLVGKFKNLENTVTKYRIHGGQVTVRRRLRSQIATTRVRLSWILGITQRKVRKNLENCSEQQGTNLPKVSRYRMSMYLMREIVHILIARLKSLFK